MAVVPIMYCVGIKGPLKDHVYLQRLSYHVLEMALHEQNLSGCGLLLRARVACLLVTG